MINWKLEGEGVACLVDDMKTADCSRCFVRGDGLKEGGTRF